jgi:glycosyltransferase involved in cell wall biosynthesis
VGGIPEFVLDGQSGLCPPAEQPDAWTAALLRLLGDPELRERLAAGARAILHRQRDPAGVAGQWLALYRQLCPGTERTP